MIIETIEGIFIEELKNRFLCTVNVNNEKVYCYVPNSSRLENYLDLKGKQILLTKNKNINSRTTYSLFAAMYDRKYIILNLNIINKLVKQLILDKQIYIEGDYTVTIEKMLSKKYKMDLYLEDNTQDTKIIMEIKSIISTSETAIFPQVVSKRSIEQLHEINKLLIEGNEVHYLLVSLSPFVNKIHLSPESEFTILIKKCISNGLILKALRLNYDGMKIGYDELIEVKY